MPKSSILGNNALKSSKDIFKSTTSIVNGERITKLPLSELYPPEFHPFQVNDDEAMTRLTENIKRYGVREPGIVRLRGDGGLVVGENHATCSPKHPGYELLCGNRRKRACELAGIEVMPVIISELDDDNSVITMVDSNLEQREKLLLSEKAWAYKVKMEALNHNGVKSDMHSVEVLARQTGESRNQIFRLIRLTDLIITLLDKVDRKQLAFNPAVELSYLTQTQQTAVASVMEKYDVKPSLSQAVKLKKMRQVGELDVEMIDAVLSENKKATKPDKEVGRFREYFPAEYTTRQMNQVITNLLRGWQTEQKNTSAQ